MNAIVDCASYQVRLMIARIKRTQFEWNINLIIKENNKINDVQAGTNS